MPFGLDFKSIIVGALFVYFALPWIMGMLGGVGNKSAKQAA